MIHGMSRDAWNEFSTTILVYMSYHIFVEPFFCVIIEDVCIPCLLTHALTCLRSGQAPQESAPPKKIRMLATYM